MAPAKFKPVFRVGADMSMSDLWIAAQERIFDELCGGLIDADEARNQLIRLGLDPHEAQDQIDEASA